MTVEFLLAAALLVGFTLLSLLRPWRRFGTGTTSSAREINAHLYRDQLAELDRDRVAGTLGAADHAQSHAELGRRLLEDTAAAELRASAAPSMRTTSLLIALLVPLLAGSLYLGLGQPAALDEGARQGPSPGEAEGVLAALAARLAAKPDDPQGWADLARSYRAMGRLRNAQAAFERIGPELDRDPALLAEYAELLATAANGNVEGKPLAMVERALRLAPDTPLALALAATAASRRNDMPQAMSYWQRLLKQLPPESADAEWVGDQLARIRDAAGGTARATAAPFGSSTSGSTTRSQ